MTETLLHLLVYIAGATFATIVGIFIGRLTVNRKSPIHAVIYRADLGVGNRYFKLYHHDREVAVSTETEYETYEKAAEDVREINPDIEIRR